MTVDVSQALGGYMASPGLRALSATTEFDLSRKFIRGEPLSDHEQMRLQAARSHTTDTARHCVVQDPMTETPPLDD